MSERQPRSDTSSGMHLVDYDDTHRERVVALLAAHTGKDAGRRRALWPWLYRDNPSIGRGRLGAVLIDGDRVLGFNGFIPVRLLSDGALVDAAWSVDTLLAPELRGKGWGVRLVDRVKASYPVMLGFGISDIQAATMLKRGYTANRDVAQYFHVNRPHTARQRLKAALQALNRLRGLPGRPATDGLTIEVGRARDLPREVERLWQAVKDSHRRIVVRDHAYLSWRYAAHPTRSYSTLLVRGEDGALRALAVFERLAERADLVDYVGASDDLPSMQLIVDTFRRTCAASALLQCTCSSSPLKSALARAGFRRSAWQPRFYVRSNLADERAIAQDWFVMDGDSDSHV